MNIFHALKRALSIVIPAIILLFIWELLTQNSERAAFLFGKPTQIIQILISRVLNGTMFGDVLATLIPVSLGFALGNIAGIALGLLLWRFPRVNEATRPYLLALGAVPAFVFAPVLVVWFGTGLGMKLVVVFLSTVLVAASQASTGATEIDKEYFNLFKAYGANDSAIFRHLVLPSASSWVFAGFRLNIGFALLGGFVGEFISSERGIAHRALVDAGLYNISAVWVSALMIAILATVLYFLLSRLEIFLLPWKQDGGERGGDLISNN